MLMSHSASPPGVRRARKDPPRAPWLFAFSTTTWAPHEAVLGHTFQLSCSRLQRGRAQLSLTWQEGIKRCFHLWLRPPAALLNLVLPEHQAPPNHLATEAHKLKPSFLRCYFLGCLEVVCKLSGEKGQAAAERFGKPASWRRGWRALSAAGEGSARTSSATPEEPQSKTSRDKETRPECFSLSKNKQQQKSRKLNPRPSSGSAENYEAGFSQRSLQLTSGYCW
ncbi:uncharacterized protein LOC116499670 [Aythya fuligula]|uniref:Uncharacterized protein LOC116499670 n=1 Tax=Aythya fuligula TaxID=219594 RepID=A0A6J3EGC5_AYTFU|nr:uncharacterized protein LOC116499670 [Aythya fuligula]